MTSGKLLPKRIEGYQVKIPYSTTIAMCKHRETKRVTYTGTCEINVVCRLCGALLESEDRRMDYTQMLLGVAKLISGRLKRLG